MWMVLVIILLISVLYRPVWWNRAYNNVKLILAFLLYHSVYRAPARTVIVRFKEELNKIPKHVAFIFNETSYRPASLAEMLTWFSSLGVDTVTFYSQQGVAERTMHSIFNCLRNKFNGQVTLSQNKITLCSENSTNDFSICNLEVIFIDKRFGKSAITKLATKAVSNNGNECLLTVDEFHKEVVQEVEFSAPELALIFGPVFSTCGYPPWHLQFTEMHHFSTHKYIQWRQVHSVLRTFANTKQNYGK